MVTRIDLNADVGESLGPWPRGADEALILLVDGPTIGGYPVLGVVPAADLPRLGQLGRATRCGSRPWPPRRGCRPAA